MKDSILLMHLISHNANARHVPILAISYYIHVWSYYTHVYTNVMTLWHIHDIFHKDLMSLMHLTPHAAGAGDAYIRDMTRVRVTHTYETWHGCGWRIHTRHDSHVKDLMLLVHLTPHTTNVDTSCHACTSHHTLCLSRWCHSCTSHHTLCLSRSCHSCTSHHTLQKHFTPHAHATNAWHIP